MDQRANHSLRRTGVCVFGGQKSCVQQERSQLKGHWHGFMAPLVELHQMCALSVGLRYKYVITGSGHSKPQDVRGLRGRAVAVYRLCWAILLAMHQVHTDTCSSKLTAAGAFHLCCHYPQHMALTLLMFSCLPPPCHDHPFTPFCSRRMRKLTNKDWAGSYPGTNVLWLVYLTELLLSSDKPIPGASAGQKRVLREFKKRLGGYCCCSDVIWDELFHGLWSVADAA